MKKILGIILLVISFLSLSSFTSREIEVGVINDNTSIENDLVSLGLTPSDYINLYEEYYDSQNDGSYKDLLENYNETYLIAVGENRLDDESTDVYLYLYNPIFHMFSFKAYYINLKINNTPIKLAYYSEYAEYDYESSDEKLQFCSVTDDYTIYKFKFNYINHINERKYELDSIKMYYDWVVDYDTYLLNKEYKNPFTATFKERDEDGKLVTDYDYNSFIYITEDVLVPVILKPEFHWNEVFDFIFSTDKEKVAFFYNFSSSKKIEQILELDVIFDTNFKITYLGCVDGVPGHDEGYVEPKNNVERTLYNEKHSYDWSSSHLEFETFKTPAKDRFTDEEFGYLEFNDDEKKQFTNYEHSVLIGINDVYYHTVSAMAAASFPCRHYEEINNLKVKRIKFETDGKIYNSYVADDPDDSEEIIIPDTPSAMDWFDEMINWIKENPLYAVLILLAVIVGLPLIISFLPMILKGIIQLVIGIIKLLFWIIFTPFRIIKSMINKAKEKKKIKQKEAIK